MTTNSAKSNAGLVVNWQDYAATFIFRAFFACCHRFFAAIDIRRRAAVLIL